MNLHSASFHLALGLSFLAGSTHTFGQVLTNGINIEPLGGAAVFPGTDERIVNFVCTDNSLSQGVSIPCDSRGGAMCNVDMNPILATPGARLKVWQLMQGQTSSSAVSSVTCTALPGGAVECFGDFSSLGTTSVEVTVRDRFGNVLASSTCAGGACSAMIIETAGGGGGGGGSGGSWAFSSTNKSGYNVKANVKCRVLSGQATVIGVGPAPIEHAASVEFSPIICITEPCPTSWPHMNAMHITAASGSSPVGFPVTVSNPAICSFSWGMSNPTTIGSSGLGAGKVACWGSGGTNVGEICDSSGDCDDFSRVLRISGLDGPGPRSATVDFDPDDLDAAQVHGAATKQYADARAVSFTVKPETLSPGFTSGEVVCDLLGRDTLAGLMNSRVRMRLTLTTDQMQAFGCDSTSQGVPQTGYSMQCIGPSGEVLASAFVSPTDLITFAAGTPIPVITVDPTSETTLDVSALGGTTCTLPSGQTVSGAFKIKVIIPSNVVGIGCDQLRVTGTHFPSVKIDLRRVTNPLVTGGLPVIARYDWIKHSFDKGHERLSWEPPVLGPTGEPSGGVSILSGSRNGVGCDIDLDSCLNTPGAVLRHRYKGWDGTIKGTLRVTGGGNGQGSIVCDYGSSGTISVHYVVCDAAGRVLAEGDVPGGLATCTIDTTCCGGPPPPGGETDWSVSATAKGNWDIKKNVKRTAAFTVTGLGTSPITGATSLSFSRIVCIVAPCPGDGTATMSAMEIDGGGMPVVKISDCSALRESPSLPSLGGPRPSKPKVTATGGRLFPVCSGTGTCDATTEMLCLTNISGPLATATRVHTAEGPSSGMSISAKLDCFPDSPPEGDPQVQLTFTGGDEEGSYGGSVPIIVVGTLIVPHPPSGSADVSCDFSGRSSTQATVECLSSTGTVLGSAVVDNGIAVTCLGAMSGGGITYIGTCDADGRVMISPFASSGQCLLPSGLSVSNVTSLRWTPISPLVAMKEVDKLKEEIKRLRNSDTLVTFSPAVHSGGLSLSPVGQATVTPRADGQGVDVSNLSCSGNDGVRIGLDTGNGGGFTLPVADLFAGARPCGGPRIRIKNKAFDGSEFARTTLHRVAAGGAMTEQYECFNPAVVALEVVLTSPTGVELARVPVSGSTVTWTDVAEGDSATLDKCYWSAAPSSGTGTNAAMRDAKEGFFDIYTSAARTVTVTGLTTSPVPGVHSIVCRPISAVGSVIDESLGSIEVTGHSMVTIRVIRPGRARLAHGSNYPPPDRFVDIVGTGFALVSERCASIYPCPWETQELVVSNIGSSGQDGVRVRPVRGGLGIGSSGQDGVAFRAVACGSWGETGGPTLPPFPPTLGVMDVSFGSLAPGGGHVTVLKLSVTNPGGTAAVTEDIYCTAGSGASSVLASVYDAEGHLIDSGVCPPSLPVRVTYCNNTAMPTFGNNGNECFLQLPDIGMACYTIQLPGHAPVAGGKVSFSDLSLTNAHINELQISGRHLDDIVIGDLQMEFPPACPADLGVQGGTAGQDGLLDNNDFVAFIDLYFALDLRADLGVQGGLPGQDGQLDNNDFVAFIDLFFAGCP